MRVDRAGCWERPTSADQEKNSRQRLQWFQIPSWLRQGLFHSNRLVCVVLKNCVPHPSSFPIQLHLVHLDSVHQDTLQNMGHLTLDELGSLLSPAF